MKKKREKGHQNFFRICRKKTLKNRYGLKDKIHELYYRDWWALRCHWKGWRKKKEGEKGRKKRKGKENKEKGRKIEIYRGMTKVWWEGCFFRCCFFCFFNPFPDDVLVFLVRFFFRSRPGRGKNGGVGEEKHETFLNIIPMTNECFMKIFVCFFYSDVSFHRR